MQGLPAVFVAQMRGQLGAFYEAFMASFSEAAWRGVRANLLKISGVEDLPLAGGVPVPWCDSGLGFREELKLGQTLEYLAGLFYLQEPSAMSSAAMLDAQPGERVLDLCAAPGGKTTQIAGAMAGRGLLVANDASPTRVQALVRNIERAGVRNAVVLMEQPHKLAGRFAGFFDRVLVDAPCSGEGMFRRDVEVVKAYTANKPEACTALQADILRHGAAMVRGGGRLVYSTCTFNELENERVIEGFLAAHGDFAPVEMKRIWPHAGMGEGHFVAVLRRGGQQARHAGAARSDASYVKELAALLGDDVADALLVGHPILHGKHLYLQGDGTHAPLDLRGLRVARSGWHVGEMAKERFVPSQGFAMGLSFGEARFALDLGEAEAWRYVRGETLDGGVFSAGGGKDKPWVLICYKKHPLGWARLVQGRLKNQLPTGWVR